MKDDQDNLPSERHVWVTSIISALARGAEGDSAWSLYPSEAAALLFEIERLRAHNTELQAHGVSLHKAAAAGAQADRAAVVAALRRFEPGPMGLSLVDMASVTTSIERGEHRREEGA